MPDDLSRESHAPPHLFRAGAVYMITGALYQDRNLIATEARKLQWRDAFVKASEMYGWSVIAWVVLNNHYHTLVRSPGSDAMNMPKYISSLHKFTARRWNQDDQTPGRKVWWNYWDTCIRSERDFLVRLKYVLWNPVKHGLSNVPADYPFSNYHECMRNWDSGLGTLNGSEEIDVPEF